MNEVSISGKRVVVVLGMHRAGTSLTARVLNLLGVELGGPLIPPAADNPTGFWEHADISKSLIRINRFLNRRPMGMVGTAGYPQDYLSLPEVRVEADKIRAVIIREVAAAGERVWGFKDPHACRMLPLFTALFTELGLQPIYVLSLRNPDEVVASLDKRDHLERAKGELLWLQHYADAIVDSGGDFAGIAHFEQWFNAPEAQIRRLADALPFLYANEAEKKQRIADALAFIQPDARHHVSDTCEASSALIARLYQALRDSDRIQYTTLAAIVRESSDMFGVWARDAEKLSRPTAVLAGTDAGSEINPVILQEISRGLQVMETEDGGVTGTKNVAFMLPPFVYGDRLSGSDFGVISLANTLVADGHGVTIAVVDEGQLATLRSAGLLDKEIKLELVPAPEIPNPNGLLGQVVRHAFDAYQWLKLKSFDIIHFLDRGGLGLYCVSARKAGVAFDRTVLSVIVSEPSLMRLEGNRQPLDNAAWVALYAAEQRAVELADHVVVTSATAYQWMLREGYALDQARVRYQFLPVDVPAPNASAEDLPIDELVYFGTLEIRKGIQLFLATANRIKAVSGKKCRLTVLCQGKANSFFRRHIRQWQKNHRIEIRIIEGMSRSEALQYIQAPNRLPLILDGSGRPTNSMLECMAMQRPFVAIHSAEREELLRMGRPGRYLCEPRPVSLLRKVEALIESGTSEFESSLQPEVLRDDWRAWHRRTSAATANVVCTREEAPLVSICVMHHERPHLLLQALSSIRQQTYSNIEVVVVDDGSTNKATIEQLKAIQQENESDRWRMVFQSNKYLGAARNTGARHARGKYLYFLDDDNYLVPNGIEVLVHTAELNKLDIVGSFSRSFFGHDEPNAETFVRSIISHMGAGLAFGTLRNGFADSNALVRRDFFERVGGNTEDYGVGKDDQEFFARALLAGGRMLLVPEPMYWARQLGVRLRHKHFNKYAGQWRVGDAYLPHVPASLRNAVRYAQGAFHVIDDIGVPGHVQAHYMLTSLSWKLTRGFREILRMLERVTHIPVKYNRVFEREVDLENPPAYVAVRIMHSISWRLTFPLRAVHRLLTLSPKEIAQKFRLGAIVLFKKR